MRLLPGLSWLFALSFFLRLLRFETGTWKTFSGHFAFLVWLRGRAAARLRWVSHAEMPTLDRCAFGSPLDPSVNRKTLGRLEERRQDQPRWSHFHGARESRTSSAQAPGHRPAVQLNWVAVLGSHTCPDHPHPQDTTMQRGRGPHLLSASFSSVMVSSGYTFLSSQILNILSMDLETDGSLETRRKNTHGLLWLQTSVLRPNFSSEADKTRRHEACWPQGAWAERRQQPAGRPSGTDKEQNWPSPPKMALKSARSQARAAAALALKTTWSDERLRKSRGSQTTACRREPASHP